jgi:P-type E1-E2 ATPase
VKSAQGITVHIPNSGTLLIRHLVMDLNGTLALDGAPLAGVKEALADLKPHVALHLVTADTFGTAAGLRELLGVTVDLLPPDRPGGLAKADLVRSLGEEGVAAMGNGANDAAMLKAASIGIAVMGPEGCVPEVLSAASVCVRDPVEGLGLLLHPKRLAATLRP